MTRWISAAVVAAAVLAAPPAEAAKPKPKPLKGGYDLTLPVPYALEAEDGSHCKDAPDGLSKHTQRTVLPHAGKFTFALSQVVGDWVVEIYDAKGTRLAIGGTLDSGETRMSVKKKSTAKQTYTILVCNYAGGPKGRVDWTFVPV